MMARGLASAQTFPAGEQKAARSSVFGGRDALPTRSSYCRGVLVLGFLGCRDSFPLAQLLSRFWCWAFWDVVSVSHSLSCCRRALVLGFWDVVPVSRSRGSVAQL